MLKKRAEGLLSVENDRSIVADSHEVVTLENSLDISLDSTSKKNEILTGNQAVSLRDNRTIFVKLREGKVHYVSTSRNLYFVDSLDFPVSEMIKKVFKGMKQIPYINQCYLDQHSFFKGAYCIVLNESQYQPVLVALRLQGIVIKITKTATSGGM